MINIRQIDQHRWKSFTDTQESSVALYYSSKICGTITHEKKTCFVIKSFIVFGSEDIHSCISFLYDGEQYKNVDIIDHDNYSFVSAEFKEERLSTAIKEDVDQLIRKM